MQQCTKARIDISERNDDQGKIRLHVEHFEEFPNVFSEDSDRKEGCCSSCGSTHHLPPSRASRMHNPSRAPRSHEPLSSVRTRHVRRRTCRAASQPNYFGGQTFLARRYGNVLGRAGVLKTKS